jgi:hypothetical protein
LLCRSLSRPACGGLSLNRFPDKEVVKSASDVRKAKLLDGETVGVGLCGWWIFPSLEPAGMVTRTKESLLFLYNFFIGIPP